MSIIQTASMSTRNIYLTFSDNCSPSLHASSIIMSSSSTFQPPPLDGSITFLPGVVDFNAEHNPTHAWSVFLSQEEPKRKIYISYPELARASHKVAHHFRPAREGAEQEVVAILVNCDVLLYMTLLVGLKRAGIVVSILLTPPSCCTIENKS